MNTTENQNYIVYMRVSTQGQSDSGLGLEAQQATIDRYVESYGGTVLGTYTDVMSGTREDRPALQQAIEHVRLIPGAKLLVSKLDRLARSVWLISQLRRENISFVVADNPFLDNFTATVYSGLAEKEAELISTRTKEALAAARRRGVTLGSPVLDEIRCTDLTAANNRRTQIQAEFRARILRVIQQIEDSGIVSCKGIAEELNRRNIKTLYGKDFSIAGISRLRRGRNS